MSFSVQYSGAASYHRQFGHTHSSIADEVRDFFTWESTVDHFKLSLVGDAVGYAARGILFSLTRLGPVASIGQILADEFVTAEYFTKHYRTADAEQDRLKFELYEGLTTRLVMFAPHFFLKTKMKGMVALFIQGALLFMGSLVGERVAHWRGSQMPVASSQNDFLRRSLRSSLTMGRAHLFRKTHLNLGDHLQGPEGKEWRRGARDLTMLAALSLPLTVSTSHVGLPPISRMGPRKRAMINRASQRGRWGREAPRYARDNGAPIVIRGRPELTSPVDEGKGKTITPLIIKEKAEPVLQDVGRETTSPPVELTVGSAAPSRRALPRPTRGDRRILIPSRTLREEEGWRKKNKYPHRLEPYSSEVSSAEARGVLTARTHGLDLESREEALTVGAKALKPRELGLKPSFYGGFPPLEITEDGRLTSMLNQTQPELTFTGEHLSLHNPAEALTVGGEKFAPIDRQALPQIDEGTLKPSS